MKAVKMQGLGNDFVIVEKEEFEKTGLSMSELARKICDRNFGIGADGMIIPDFHSENGYDLGWYFYNNDGTTAQMCGNGIRCFAKYVYKNGFIKTKKMRVKTLAGIITPEILENGMIKVDMGKPVLECAKIPCTFKNNLNQKIKVSDREFNVNAVSMGNPHCVIFTEENPVESAKKYGAELEKNEFYPEKTNVEFAKIKSKTEIDMSVYERGCGMTLACGTGACAVTVASILNNLTDHAVKVNLAKGALNIEWSGNPQDSVFMSGPAEFSFFAEYLC
ncbi:diaminopimelate epimerase [bacterium]|nr:diaminopimelate epimerase [bacterium]